MRQLTRLLARARIYSMRPKTLTKALRAAGDPLWRKERQFFKALVEVQRSNISHDLKHLRNVVIENKSRIKETLYPLQTTGLIYDSLGNFDRKRREPHGLETSFNHVMNLKKLDVKERALHKKKLLKEAVKNRKDQIEMTERKILEKSREILQDLRHTKNLMKERVEKVVERENIYTIPNLLCVSRIAFSPYLGYLIVTENYQYAFGFMIVAGISDWLDGWIARNYKSQSSKFGSFLDPMADKVLIGTLFLSLTYVELIPVPLTALIVARDVALVIAGFVIRYQSLPPPRTLSRYFDATHVTAQLAPTWISKINTGIQLALVGSTLAAPVFGYVGHPALDWMCYITAASTVLAAASYVTNKDTYRYLGRK